MFRLLIISGWLVMTTVLYAQQDERYLDPEYWKKQALETILPPWTLNAQDTNGSFFGTLNREWTPQPDAQKYPSMLSRHLFSYTAAFMLSGDADYLDIATSIKKYLIRYGWDTRHGGWYDALKGNGQPAELTKSTFVQVYAVTGLVLYYAATHDDEAMDYILKTNQLLESKVWDEDYGGYYNQMTQTWTVLDDKKSFSSLVTPVSGYLTYLYLATRKATYRQQSERIMNTLMTRAVDAVSGWVGENYTREWNEVVESPTSDIHIGHNLEAAWMWSRLYRLNGREDYLEAAQKLSAGLAAYGYVTEPGMWAAQATLSGHPGSYTYWWIQAYGLLFDVYQFKTTAIEPFIKRFERSAKFWDQSFIDQTYGDTYYSVNQDGSVKESIKANQYKTAYHSMENALLLYWYLSAWVVQRPIKIYLSVPDQGGEIFFPILIEDERLTIKSARFLKGGQAKIIQRGRAVATDPGQSGILEITVK